MATPAREVIDLKEVREYVLAFLAKHPAAACKWVKDGPIRPNDSYRRIYFTVAHTGAPTEDEQIVNLRERELAAVFTDLIKHLKPLFPYVLLDWPSEGAFGILVHVNGPLEEEALETWRGRATE